MAQSKLQRAYNKLRADKKKYCSGKLINSAVKASASNYIRAAVAAGQTKKEATAKAKRVLSSGCKMSSSIAGRKNKKRK